MGTPLTGNSVGSSYTGLLKMNDNQPIGDLSPRPVSDGAGTDSALSIAQRRVDIETDNASIRVTNTDITTSGLTTIDGNATGNITIQNTPQALVSGTNAILSDTTFTNYFNAGATSVVAGGTIDFSGATVTGLPGGAAGLESGAGTDSMKSSASLTTTGAEAYGNQDIALGNGVITGDSNNPGATSNNISIGDNIGGGYADRMIKIGADIPAKSFNNDQIFIGNASTINGRQNISIGWGVPQANSDRGTGVGYAVRTGGDAISIGYNARTNSQAIRIGSGTTSTVPSESISIGYQPSMGFGSKAVSIGWQHGQAGLNSVNIGRGSAANGSWALGLAYNANASGEQATALGYATVASQQGTFAAADRASATASRAIAIGGQSTSALADAAVIGPGLTALWAAGTTVNQLAMANYAALNFADDTAAAAGNVPLGGVYHTSGALKVRIA